MSSSILGLALRQVAARPSSGSHSLRPSSWLTRRYIHKKKNLSYPIEEGVGDFLPPAALKIIAVDYQEGLLERLNDEVRGE
jgi:Fe-Mn family superoxide dismutase